MILTSFGSRLKILGNFNPIKACPAHSLDKQNHQLCILFNKVPQHSSFSKIGTGKTLYKKKATKKKLETVPSVSSSGN
jgi:hypothetical protein